ncbi:MAG TPA: GntR family transcriptional regulator [Solirubrobacteraceae bacterium]|nr:GntR family transcriptional regulator [Solirubrobacteraceae bacterium]
MTQRPADSSDRPRNLDLGGLEIDRNADVPIGVQLAWALRSRIDEGELAPGQRLPGLRDLAEATGMNVNTVRAVYQRLEQEGLIESQQGSGTFVTTSPRQRSAVGAIAASAAREARDTGVDPREVAAALYTSSDPSEGPDEQAAHRRRLLRAQIGMLERTLGEMEATYPGLAPPPGAIRGDVGPTLLSAEQLEQVRTHLVRRLATVQAAIDAHLASSDGEDRTARSGARSNRTTKSMAPATPKAPRAPKRAKPPTSGTSPAPAGA